MTYVSIQKSNRQDNGIFIELGKQNKKYQNPSIQEHDYISIVGDIISPSSNNEGYLLKANELFISHT